MTNSNSAGRYGKDGRTRSDLTDRRDNGPYIATVVSHLDSKFMGSLKVRLNRTMTASGDEGDGQNLLTAFYASPFYGVTNYKALGPNDDYRETQQSYGFWAVPPDPGSRVLITFVEGRADICFWFACVPDDYMNFMVPDGRPATTLVTPGSNGVDQTGKKLPVGEYNKIITNPGGNSSPTTYQKPVNRDFADRLTEEGLLEDDTRGLTTSSARREVPSAVFGMNTPGPLDKRTGARGIVAGDDDHNMTIYSQRLGGHSIVMDDGDANILRRGHPGETPSEYVDVERSDDPVSEEMRTLPANELFRIRTRTGHQILLHNTEDLIYISNSRGTAWVELTSNGKIDIYAQDSISMHTEGEFNVTADSNINLTSGGTINLNATQSIKSTAGSSIDNTAGTYIASDANDDVSVTAGDYISMRASSDFVATAQSGNVNITGASGIELDSYSGVNILAQGGSFRATANGSAHLTAGSSIVLASPEIHNKTKQYFVDTSVANILVGTNLYITAVGVDIYSLAFKLESSDSIDMQTEGQLIATAAGTLKLKTGGSFEVGSTNLSINSSSMQTTGSIASKTSIKAQSVSAPNGEFNTLNSDGSGTDGNPAASTPGYSVYDPGVAAAASVATSADNATPPAATPGATPTPAAPALVASRVPQHEPWFQHENLNPTAYANIRAGDEPLDSFVFPTPDPFSAFASPTGAASMQPATAGRNNAAYDDDSELEEVNIVGTDRNGNTINVNGFTSSSKSAMQYFINKGYKLWQAAGIVGAMIVESGNNVEPGAYIAPDALRDNKDGTFTVVGGGNLGARGIVQWRENGGRLTKIERYIGKPILIQPEMDVNAVNYTRLKTQRLPTLAQNFEAYVKLPYINGCFLAPANASFIEQIDAVEWELTNGEYNYNRLTLGAYIKTVETDNPEKDIEHIVFHFEDVFLKSGAADMDKRYESAKSLYRAWARGSSTKPYASAGDPAAAGAAPKTGSVAGDPEDASNSNVRNVVEQDSTVSVRIGPINKRLVSALNKAAHAAGITRISWYSGTNEPVRQINIARELPITEWGTRPPRADMKNFGTLKEQEWKRLINGEWVTRPSGAYWRLGSERHDTGLAADIYLYAIKDDQEVKIDNTSNYGKGKIAAFCAAFVKYGGRGIGHATEYMGDRGIHVDMLGGGITDATNYRAVPGLSPSNVVGWNTSVLSMWNWEARELPASKPELDPNPRDVFIKQRRREYAWLIGPVCAEWERLVRGS